MNFGHFYINIFFKWIFDSYEIPVYTSYNNELISSYLTYNKWILKRLKPLVDRHCVPYFSFIAAIPTTPIKAAYLFAV